MRIIGFILMMALAVHIQAQSKEDWLVLDDDTFKVYFKKKNEDVAKRFLSYYLSFQKEMEQNFDWKLRETDVILKDYGDIYNGASLPFPKNTNILYLSYPNSIELFSHANIHQKTIKHEMVHLYHLDKANETYQTLRSILGDMIFFYPNIQLNNWYIEGYAVYLETDKTKGYGRGYNGLYDAYMRSYLLNNPEGYLPIEKMNAVSSIFPYGFSYYYGYNYFEYIQEEFSEKRVRQYINNLSNYGFPFLNYDTNSYDTLRQSYQVTSNRFVEYLNKKYTSQLTKIGQENKKTPLVKKLLSSAKPIYTKNNHILFLKNDGYYNPRIELIKNSKQKIDKFYKNSDFEMEFSESIADYDYHPEKGILYTQPSYCSLNNISYNSIFYYSFETHEDEEIVECNRANYIRWSKDGKSIYFTRIDDNLNSYLVEYNIKNKKEKILLSSNDPKLKLNLGVFTHFDLSPDGKKIVMLIQTEDYGWDLYLYQIPTKEFKKITRLSGILLTPSFADNSNIYFSANSENQVFNVFHLNLKNNKITQITNTKTIATYPKVNKKLNELAYVSLTKKGYTLEKMSLDFSYKKEIQHLRQEKSRVPYVQITNEIKEKIENTATYDYNPFLMDFIFWFPMYSVSSDKSIPSILNLNFFFINPTFNVSSFINVNSYSYSEYEEIAGQSYLLDLGLFGFHLNYGSLMPTIHSITTNGTQVVNYFKYTKKEQISIDFLKVGEDLLGVNILPFKAFHSENYKEYNLVTDNKKPDSPLLFNIQQTTYKTNDINNNVFDLNDYGHAQQVKEVSKGFQFNWLNARKYYYTPVVVDGFNFSITKENTTNISQDNDKKLNETSVVNRAMFELYFRAFKTHGISTKFRVGKSSNKTTKFTYASNGSAYDFLGNLKIKLLGYPDQNKILQSSQNYEKFQLAYTFQVHRFDTSIKPDSWINYYNGTFSTFYENLKPWDNANDIKNEYPSYNMSYTLNFDLIVFNLNASLLYSQGTNKDLGGASVQHFILDFGF